MDRLGATLGATGLVGAVARLTTDSSVSREMFSNTSGGVGFIVFFMLVLLAFFVMSLYSIYNIMPRNKAMHLVLAIFLGSLWTVPAVFYHAWNGYSLRK